MLSITETKVVLAQESGNAPIRGYATVAMNGLVIHEMKLIESNGRRFVAFPTRRLEASCHSCDGKNFVRAKFCNWCGEKLACDSVRIGRNGKPELYLDVVHPVTSTVRNEIEKSLWKEYERQAQ